MKIRPGAAEDGEVGGSWVHAQQPLPSPLSGSLRRTPPGSEQAVDASLAKPIQPSAAVSAGWLQATRRSASSICP